jgi:CheY-like chemotaxis protein
MLMNNLCPILLVEDDAVDIMTVKRCFKQLKIPNQLLTAGNGEEALLLLSKLDTFLPCIILLDINMPKMNGLEFLYQLKQSACFKKTPVVMLSSSKEESDVTKCFELGVAGYMVKPVEYEDFVNILQLLCAYWSKSELPL